MDNGRIIRIIDTDRVIFNLGASDGVGRGDRFGIFTPTTDIVDPETGERLGNYRERKAIIVAQFVADRYTIAGAPRQAAFTSALASGLGLGRSRYLEPPDLPVEQSEVEPLPTSSRIRVGDTVELLQQRDPPSESPTLNAPEPENESET